MSNAKHRQGSVRPRGDKWEAQALAGVDPATGKRIRYTKTFARKRDAERWASGVYRKRTPDSQPPTELTAGAVLARWLDAQVYRHDVGRISANTLSWYRSAVERHLLTAPLAATPVKALTTTDVEALLSAKRASGRLDGTGGLSETSVRRLWLVLHAAMRWAMSGSREWLSTNPAAIDEPPQANRPKGDGRAWDADELRAFMIETDEHRFAAAFRLQAVLGLRRGEVLGLRWRDVSSPDIGEPTVAIVQTLVQVDGKPTLNPPKTDTSTRRIGIDSGTVAMLEARQRTQDADRKAWGAGWNETGLVFTRENGQWIRPDYYSKVFKRFAKRAGLDGTPHTLRHTAATLMLTHNVNPKVVADVLGHSSTRITTDVYQATVERMGREAVEGVSAVLK